MRKRKATLQQSHRTAKHIKTETAVLLVSDLQFGRISYDYNPEEGLRAIARVRDAVIDIKRDHLANYKFDKLVIAYLGDIVDGDTIFPGQAWELQFGATDQIHALSIFLDEHFHQPLIKEFGRVSLIGVPGNHGRSTPRPGQTTGRTNYDLQLYRNWSLMYRKDKNITWDFDYSKSVLNVDSDGHVKVNSPEEYVYIKGHEIRGWKILLYHGHGIVSWAGIPFYGILNRILRWIMTLGRFNIICMGDKHVSFEWPIMHDLNLFLNGTALSGCEWGLQKIGLPAGHTWWFFGVSDKRPVSFRYAIQVVHPKEMQYKKLNGK